MKSTKTQVNAVPVDVIHVVDVMEELLHCLFVHDSWSEEVLTYTPNHPDFENRFSEKAKSLARYVESSEFFGSAAYEELDSAVLTLCDIQHALACSIVNGR